MQDLLHLNWPCDNILSTLCHSEMKESYFSGLKITETTLSWRCSDFGMMLTFIDAVESRVIILN